MAEMGGKAYTEVGEDIRDKAKKDGKIASRCPTKERNREL